MKPICVRCQRFYRPHKTGRWFVEGMPIEGFQAPPGTAVPDLWKPYKVWVGDEWICHGCGHLTIVGVGWKPVSERHDDNFLEMVGHATYLQVNDC